MPQFKGFAIHEAMMETAKSTAEAFGIKNYEESEGEFLEDFEELRKTWKEGQSVTFSLNFQGTIEVDSEGAAAIKEEIEIAKESGDE